MLDYWFIWPCFLWFPETYKKLSQISLFQLYFSAYQNTYLYIFIYVLTFGIVYLWRLNTFRSMCLISIDQLMIYFGSFQVYLLIARFELLELELDIAERIRWQLYTSTDMNTWPLWILATNHVFISVELCSCHLVVTRSNIYSLVLGLVTQNSALTYVRTYLLTYLLTYSIT